MVSKNATAARTRDGDRQELFGQNKPADSKSPSAYQLIVSPADRRDLFHVDLAGRRVCSSRTPLLTAARVLLAEGADLAAPIALRHAGADHDAITTTIGTAAKLTVAERDYERPRLVSWKANSFRAVAPPMRPNGQAGTRPRQHGRALHGEVAP